MIKTIMWILIVLGSFSSVALSQPVKLCTDDAEQPPYVYYQRVNGTADKAKLTGALIDLIAEAMKLANLEYSIETVPWKRCLREVQEFDKAQTYEIAFHGTLNEDRLNAYYATTWIYARTGAFWYSKNKYPNGPSVNGYADLKNFKLCGLLGNNYTGYFVDNEIVDRNANDHQAVFTKVAKDRCDLFLSNLTIPLGKVTIGELKIPPEIVGKRIPGATPGTFHMFISKTSPRAHTLLTLVNQALLTLEFRGISDKLFNQHIPECGRSC